MAETRKYFLRSSGAVVAPRQRPHSVSPVRDALILSDTSDISLHLQPKRSVTPSQHFHTVQQNIEANRNDFLSVSHTVPHSQHPELDSPIIADQTPLRQGRPTAKQQAIENPQHRTIGTGEQLEQEGQQPDRTQPSSVETTESQTRQMTETAKHGQTHNLSMQEDVNALPPTTTVGAQSAVIGIGPGSIVAEPTQKMEYATDWLECGINENWDDPQDYRPQQQMTQTGSSGINLTHNTSSPKTVDANLDNLRINSRNSGFSAVTACVGKSHETKTIRNKPTPSFTLRCCGRKQNQALCASCIQLRAKLLLVRVR